MKYPENIGRMNLTEEKKITTEKGESVVLTYEGTKSFTLVQEKAEVVSKLRFDQCEWRTS